MINIIERIAKKIMCDRRLELDRRRQINTDYLKPERRSKYRRRVKN